MKYIDMREALRQVRESTCPKCEGEACQCPQSETLEVTNADKMIILLHIKITNQVMNTIILQKI